MRSGRSGPRRGGIRKTGRNDGTNAGRGTMVSDEGTAFRASRAANPHPEPTVMPLSDEERAAISRANARKSTGPKTPEGKARSSKNALKHGLRAEAFALPNEDAQ